MRARLDMAEEAIATLARATMPEASGALGMVGLPAFTTDKDGFLTSYNSEAEAFWGWRPSLGEQRWCGAWRLLTPDGAPLEHEACPLADCLREKAPNRGRFARAIRPDGSTRDFTPLPTPLRDASGNIVGAVNILVDVTGLDSIVAPIPARRRPRGPAGRLEKAIAAGEFELHYQPILRLPARQLAGFEALVRWRHPRRGLIPPADFIPLAESSGLIARLGAWVLDHALADAAAWPVPLTLAVNLSARQFAGCELLPLLRRSLARYGFPAERLELEVTESVMLDQDAKVFSNFRELRAMGVRLVLDDFGTKYASLSYLRAFAFDKLKIDQSFLQDAIWREDCRAILRATARLAHDLGMVATAEGVASAAHLEVAIQAGCEEGQGFHLGRPLPAGEVAASLRDGTAIRT